MRSRLMNPVGWGCALVLSAAATLVFAASAGEIEGWFGRHFGWIVPLLGFLLLGPPLSLLFGTIARRFRELDSDQSG